MILLTEGKTNWKYILIVLILAVIVGGGVLWWIKKGEVAPIEFPEIKKPEKVVEDETANWKVYKDEVYGFEIKYPKDWTIEEAKIEEAKEIVKKYLSFSPLGKTYVLGEMGNRQPISILVSKGGIEAYRSIHPKKEGAEAIIVNNYSTIREERDFGEIFYIIQNPKDDTVVTFENWIQVIEDLVKPSEKKELENIFDQMLSTFKFLEEVKKSEIISLDDTWNKYINYDLGFSMKILKKVSVISCDETTMTLVPVKIFEDKNNNSVFMTWDYYDLYTKSGCKKISRSLENIKEDTEEGNLYGSGWQIIVKNINNESEINNLANEYYGPNCLFKDKKPSEQNGVYDVYFKCNNDQKLFSYEIGVRLFKYYPKENKIMTILPGWWEADEGENRECFFHNFEYSLQKCAEDEMVNSFRFED